MSKSRGKYQNDKDWIDAVWHVRMERLSIANLLGDRPLERSELEFLEAWSKHAETGDKELQLRESRLRYLLDTGDISVAEVEADRLVNSAKDAGNRSFLRRACGWRAVVYREQSRYPKAISDFETAENCAENELQRMEIWLDKGMTLVYANQYPAAERMLLGAIEIARKYNDINSQGTAWNNLGICYGQQRKSLPAIEAYDRAIAFYQQTGYKLGSAMASGNLSEIYLSRGQLDKALELSRQCRKLGEEAEDVISIALGQDIEGRVLTELEDYREAAGRFRDSFRIFSEVNDLVAQMMCGTHLVICLANSGQLGEAGQLLKQLETLASLAGREGPDPNLMAAQAVVLNAGIGGIQFLEKARASLEAGEKDASTLILMQAEMHARQGEPAKARKMLEHLLAIPREKLTNLFRVRMHSLGWKLYSDMGLPFEAGEQKEQGQALLREMEGSYTDRGLWERYCRKKEVRALLDQ